MKVAVIAANGPEILGDHIRLHAAKKTFAEVEDIASSFIRNKGLSKDPNAMEVDAIYGKGKDGKKGKGKCKDSKGKDTWNQKTWFHQGGYQKNWNNKMKIIVATRRRRK